VQWLEIRHCSRFAWAGGIDGGGEQPPPQPSPVADAPAALPALAGACVAYAPALTDAWFTHTPGLAHLVLADCDAVVGSAAAMGARLPALTHLAVTDCHAFTGVWLGAAGGGASTRLEALSVRRCPALRLPDALAPVPHPRLRRVRVEGSAAQLSDELLGARLPAVRHLTAWHCAGFAGGPGLGATLPDLADLTALSRAPTSLLRGCAAKLRCSGCASSTAHARGRRRWSPRQRAARR
jgi:hypothetical protein